MFLAVLVLHSAQRGHRDDATLHDLDRDQDLEEMSAIAAKG